MLKPDDKNKHAIGADGAVEDVLVGKRLGHYVVLQPLAGGMAGSGLHRAQDLRGDGQRETILQVLPGPGASAQGVFHRLEREVDAVRQLSHPSIVAVHEIGMCDGGEVFLALELLDGVTLSTVIRECEPFDTDTVTRLGIQVADALAAAHACGVLHLDLKPANIVLSDSPPHRDRAQVLGFGVARYIDEARLRPRSVGGMARSTAAYLSPEQCFGGQLDVRTDLYSLGVVLYEMATGCLPFASEDPTDLLMQHVADAVVRPRQRIGSVPAHLDELVMDLLEKDPPKRPRSAEEVIDRLRSRDLANVSATTGAGPLGNRIQPPSAIRTTHPADSAASPPPVCGFGGSLVGQVVAGRYRVLEVLGEGGAGRVHRAEDQLLRRQVALKVLHSRHHTAGRRFMREAQITANLRCSHTVRVYDFGQLDDGTPYLVMELLHRFLDEIIEEEGRLLPLRVARILGQVCISLAEAHRRGLVHRDLKPGNIALDPSEDGGDEFVRVTDFGIAKLRDDTITESGTVLGTAWYMSPEQASAGNVGPPSDVYSLGVVAYEMLTGGLPFDAESDVAVLLKHVREKPPPLPGPDSGDHAAMKRIVARCLRKRPGDRYVTVEELRAALQAVGGKRPGGRLDAPARPVEPPQSDSSIPDPSSPAAESGQRSGRMEADAATSPDGAGTEASLSQAVPQPTSERRELRSKPRAPAVAESEDPDPVTDITKQLRAASATIDLPRPNGLTGWPARVERLPADLAYSWELGSGISLAVSWPDAGDSPSLVACDSCRISPIGKGRRHASAAHRIRWSRSASPPRRNGYVCQRDHNQKTECRILVEPGTAMGGSRVFDLEPWARFSVDGAAQYSCLALVRISPPLEILILCFTDAPRPRPSSPPNGQTDV